MKVYESDFLLIISVAHTFAYFRIVLHGVCGEQVGSRIQPEHAEPSQIGGQRRVIPDAGWIFSV